ncbi:MAG: serpin family protein, partial [Chlamydiae bacterium]|nr:serpin family protein [Chlamydiota bacterium]
MKKFAMIFLALQPLFANFTVNLGQKIETSPKNWIFSPLSISTCLEMVMEGTANETLDEMKSVLGSKKSVSFSKYLPQTPTDFELNLTEGVFLRNGFSILKSYETVLKTSFDALIASVPFNRETARYINKWVEGQTHQKIQNLIQESDLSYASQMVLINCLYFQGNWAFPFLNQNTHEDLFFSTPVNTVKTLFMEQFHELSYAETDRYQAVLLPFVSKNKTCHPA